MAKANYPIDPIEQVRRGKARYCAEGWRIARLQLRRTILEITPQ